MLRNTFTNRLLLVTAVLCTASLLFFANACNEKLGVVDAEKGFPAESVAEFGQGYLIGFHGEPDEELILNVGGRILRAYSSFPILHIDVPEHAVQELRDNPNVRYVERNASITFETSDASFNYPKGTGLAITSEANLSASEESESIIAFHHSRIGVQAAWNAGHEGKGVVVAILTSGIEEHDDLDGNIIGGESFLTGGPPSQRYYWVSTNGYGTHIAGIVGANGKMRGVAPEVSMISLKTHGAGGTNNLDTFIQAIYWCIDDENEVDIILMPFIAKESEAMEDAIDAAWAAGKLLISGAGNDPYSIYPAAYTNVLSVSAANVYVTNIDSTSQIGELMAPGREIFSTNSQSDDGYSKGWGTGAAAAFVAGVAALVWDQYDSSENGPINEWVKNKLLKHTEDINGLNLVRADRVLEIGGTGHIHGKVTLGGDPIFGATITATATVNSATFSTTSSANAGYYLIVPEGTYNITASFDGLEHYFVDEEVNHDQGLKLDIELSDEVGPPVETFTITASAGEGGSIDPSGDIPVSEGADQSFTIIADEGYQISDVLVDGISAGVETSYTFYDVQSNHTIHAEFETAATAPLSIDVFDLINTSNPQFARVTVYWEVSGENLKTVTLEISGPETDDETFNVSGDSASGTHEFSFRRGWGTYTVTLSVTDDSRTISDSDEITI